MQEDQVIEKQNLNEKSNRPHCLYLWYLRGIAVCSEEQNDRSCAYPFWNCPARVKPAGSQKNDVHTVYGTSQVRSELLDEPGSL
jgi:hypothetical protein